MFFNTQQLQYLVEIERTRSISLAAANLYMGQPNLSRMLREMEANVGFSIFERTRRGVRPTQQGVLFLQHARNMLREAEFIEQLGPRHTHANRFRICIPRSFVFMEQVSQFLQSLSKSSNLDAVIRECHPRQALEFLDSGSAEIAIIRYSMEYQDYFSEQAVQRKLALLPLSTTEYQIILSAANPLAAHQQISKEEISSFTEILHRDVFYPAGKGTDVERKIYAVDRMAQQQLLRNLPNAYLWAEPLPADLLHEVSLKQLPCASGSPRYQNMLIYKPQCAMSETEKAFLTWLQK